MSKFDPNLTSQGDENFDRLLAGDFDRETATVTIESGQNLTRGAVLGEVSASGEHKLVDSAAVDGSENPKAVLAEDADASAGTVEAPVYLTGTFNRAAMSVGGTDTVADHEAALRDLSIFVKDTVSR